MSILADIKTLAEADVAKIEGFLSGVYTKIVTDVKAVESDVSKHDEAVKARVEAFIEAVKNKLSSFKV